ncbi:MAG: exopolyphosphatase [Gammaproteobacteria bacterium]|nr:exopolyphosphatase [Gammaproteobacteria bacterium]
MAVQYRLLTRGDFDGIVCAALLREQGLVQDVAFVHPQDMQAGRIAVDDGVVTANLPYVAGCHLAFDHHSSELLRMGKDHPDNLINDPEAASCARVIYDHFGGAAAFPNIPATLLLAVDKADSAQYSEMEILDPYDWTLVNFVLDARTGLGRFREFRISNEAMLMKMIDLVRSRSGEEILLDRDVSERVRLYFEHEELFRQQLRRCSREHGDVLLIDLRREDPIFAGNRFMSFALFPKARASIHCLRGPEGRTVFAIGRSILDRSSPVHIGNLCLQYGGGGHAAAGTCQVPTEKAEEVLAELIGALRQG